MEVGERLVVSAPIEFASWPAEHGRTRREIWVILYKRSSGKQLASYEQLVEVALCYGWIDGMMKTLDAERYAQRFSPRRPRSNWTWGNRLLARKLIRKGRMTAAGYAALPPELKVPTGQIER